MTEPTNDGDGKSLVVRRREGAERLITKYRAELEAVTPRHVNNDAFMGLALAYVKRDLTVLDATARNPQSLVLALRECAALGHMPMKGTFALVPFKNKRATGGIEVVGVEEYRGVVERMYRAGGVQSVHVELVRANDTNRAKNGPPDWQPWMELPDHRVDPFATEEERGDLVAVYAWAKLRNGATSQVVWMNAGEMRKHEKATPFWTGPWRPDMWRKTALHKLERYVPTSVEYRMEQGQSWAAAAQMTGLPEDAPDRRFPEADDPSDTNDPDEVVDGEPVDDPAPANATRVQATAGPPTDGPDWSDVQTRRPPA